MFHPHGDLAKLDAELFQSMWEKLDDAKEEAQMEVDLKSLKEGTEVVEIRPGRRHVDVHVRTGRGDGLQTEETLRTRFVVWAAQEFQLLRRLK